VLAPAHSAHCFGVEAAVLVVRGEEHDGVRVPEDPVEVPGERDAGVRENVGVVHPYVGAGIDEQVAIRLRRWVPGVVRIADERPPEQGDPSAFER